MAGCVIYVLCCTNRIGKSCWERKDNDDDEVHLFPINIVASDNEWRVVIQKNRNLLRKRDFKTKSQALKFAKNYMKKHPRG